MSSMMILIAAYGVCFGLMNEKAALLNRVLYAIPLFRREDGNVFKRMFKCSYCTGFHAGWMVWLVGIFPQFILSGLSPWEMLADGLIAAFASAVFCYAVDTILQWFER